MSRIARSIAASSRSRRHGRARRARTVNDGRPCSRYSVMNNRSRSAMLKSAVFASLLVASLIAIPVASEARPVAPESVPAISNILPVQGHWQRCNWLRERIREAEGAPLLRAPLGAAADRAAPLGDARGIPQQ